MYQICNILEKLSAQSVVFEIDFNERSPLNNNLIVRVVMIAIKTASPLCVLGTSVQRVTGLNRGVRPSSRGMTFAVAMILTVLLVVRFPSQVNIDNHITEIIFKQNILRSR